MTRARDIAFGSSGGSGGSALSISTSTSSTPQFITFVSGASTTSIGITASNLTFIPSSGSLGVGTTNPTSSLDVNGTIKGTLRNYAETINVVGNTGTAATINITNGNFVTATLTGNCTFTFTTGISTGAVSFTLFLANDATPSRVITWPVAVVWPGGTLPTRTTTASKTDVYTFFTLNNGTTWYGNIAQYNY